MYPILAAGFTGITLSSNGYALIVTLLLPVLIAIVTKEVTSATKKALLLIVLNGLVVFIVRNTHDGVSILSSQAMYDWAVTTAISLASYLGFWQRLDVNAKLAPTKGI